MADLSLALLGAFQVERDGQRVAGFESIKVRALLAYLTLEADRPHRREVLAGLLWPELADTAARTNLRQALANLREVIGDASATPPFLLITRDTIQFNPASDYYLDVVTFEALLAACESHAHRRLERCRSCATRMEQAIALYRGDFLSGFSVGDSAAFEEWQLSYRERLHQQTLATLVLLANYHERRGDDEPARRYLQRQLELDPWREEAHRQLMGLLARGGQRSAALAQYETCRRILARDLDVALAAETTALYERIRNDELSIEHAELRSAPPQNQVSTLNSQRSMRHNFPAQTTLLIGRGTELVELGALLENPAYRLITIVGPGGIGKTRLALAAASEQAETFTHGAVFVPLAGISSTAFLAPAILSALDVALQVQRDPREQLLDYLREKELLLLLDNIEQLLLPDESQDDGAATLLADILAHAPGVTLLVTSRERLVLQGEWLFDLSGLSYPASVTNNDIESYDAVRLFVQRASQVRRQFGIGGEAPAIARICRLVEGLPLAIELAATMLRTRSCAAIAAAIESNLSVLAIELRGVPERQRSIRATFEHSWRLLSDDERCILACLSVFRGGFTQEAATQVAHASPQLLAALVDKSLLRWDGSARYDIHELVRQFAGEKLEQTGEAGGARRQHAAHFLALVETAEPWLSSGERGSWLERLEREHDNLRAALAWCRATAEAGELGLRMVGALFWFWMNRSYVSEGRVWAEGLLAAAGSSVPPHAKASALYSAGALAWMQDDYAVARALLMESVECWRTIGDQRGLASALCYLGMVACDQNDYIAAHDLCAESVAIFRELHDTWSLAFALHFWGNVAYERGDYAAARPIYEESTALWRTVSDPWELARPVTRLGKIACKEGDYALARVLLEKSLALWRQFGQRWQLPYILEGLAEVALMQEEYRQAATQLAEILALFQEFGLSHGIVQTIERFALVAAGQAQLERAARLWGVAQTQRQIISAGIPLGDRRSYDHAVATTRAQLGETAFAAAWAEGRALPLEQAIAYALEGSKVDSGFPIGTSASLQ